MVLLYELNSTPRDNIDSFLDLIFTNIIFKVGDLDVILLSLFIPLQLLTIIEAYLMSCGVLFRRLDGETKPEKRNEIVKEFNADPTIFVCLLSTT